MQAELVKTFYFEAAHALPNLPPGHKCSRMHGHSYRVDVHIVGPVGQRTGWVMDFGQVKAALEPVIAELDHHVLHEIPGLENSTAERLAAFLWGRVADRLPGLSAVTVWESETARVTYRGE